MDKTKWNNAKTKVKAKAKELEYKARVFFVQHEEEIILASAVVIPAIVAGTKSASKAYVAHKEEQRRKLMQYDPALGHYNQLKRELTSNDWNLIMSMKRAEDITLTECLIRLNLVKN